MENFKAMSSKKGKIIHSQGLIVEGKESMEP